MALLLSCARGDTTLRHHLEGLGLRVRMVPPSHVRPSHEVASGTLLMNLSSRQWCSTMLSCGGFPDDLRPKLGAEPVPAHAIVGTVSPFVSSR